MEPLEYSINDNLNEENKKIENNSNTLLCIKIFLGIFCVLLITLIALFTIITIIGNNELKDSINKSNNNKVDISEKLDEMKIYMNKTQEKEGKNFQIIENKIEYINYKLDKNDEKRINLETKMKQNDKDKITINSKINDIQEKNDVLNYKINNIIDEKIILNNKIEKNDKNIIIINKKIDNITMEEICLKNVFNMPRKNCLIPGEYLGVGIFLKQYAR